MAALAGLNENISSKSRSNSMFATTSATQAASPAVEAGSGMGAVEELNTADDEGAASAQQHETATADSARAEGLRRAEMLAAAFANAPHALTAGTSSRASSSLSLLSHSVSPVFPPPCLFYLTLSRTLLAVSL